MFSEDKAYHIAILRHFLTQLFDSEFLDIDAISEQIYLHNRSFPPASRYRIEYYKSYVPKDYGRDEVGLELPAREIVHQVIERIAGPHAVIEAGVDETRLGEHQEKMIATKLVRSSRTLRGKASYDVKGRVYMQRRAKTKTARQIFSMPPELVNAIKRAALERGISASLLVSQILEADYVISSHLRLDSK